VPNLYERGHRDGERGLEPQAFTDRLAHDLWATHVLYHGLDVSSLCGLECAGVQWLGEDTRKRRRQIVDALAGTRHVCPECGAGFTTESRAEERQQYQAGYEAGRLQRGQAQQRRRNDQARRTRRARRR
jgi:hypothetical protein